MAKKPQRQLTLDDWDLVGLGRQTQPQEAIDEPVKVVRHVADAEQDNPLKRGWNAVKSSVGLGSSLSTGDYDSAAQNIAEQDAYAKRNPGSEASIGLQRAWQSGDGIWGGITAVADEIANDYQKANGFLSGVSSVGENVKAMGSGILAQVPNMVLPMAGMVGGAAAGSAAGPIGTVAGGFAGASAGNAAVGVSEAAMRQLQKAGINPQDADAVKEFLKNNGDSILGETAVKGAVIGAVDTATAGAAHWLLTGPGKVASSRALTTMGVDAADKQAVKEAVKSTDFKKLIQADPVYIASKSGIENAARNTTAAALEPVGEFAGEYAGSMAATGEADAKDAALEAFSSLGQSAIMFGGQKAYAAATNPQVEKLKEGADAGGLLSKIATQDAKAKGAIPEFDDISTRATEAEALVRDGGMVQKMREMAPQHVEAWLGAFAVARDTLKPTVARMEALKTIEDGLRWIAEGKTDDVPATGSPFKTDLTVSENSGQENKGTPGVPLIGSNDRTVDEIPPGQPQLPNNPSPTLMGLFSDGQQNVTDNAISENQNGASSTTTQPPESGNAGPANNATAGMGSAPFTAGGSATNPSRAPVDGVDQTAGDAARTTNPTVNQPTENQNAQAEKAFQTSTGQQAAQPGSATAESAAPSAAASNEVRPRKLVAAPADITAARAPSGFNGTAAYRKRVAQIAHFVGQGFTRIEGKTDGSAGLLLVNNRTNQAFALKGSSTGVDATAAARLLKEHFEQQSTATLDNDIFGIKAEQQAVESAQAKAKWRSQYQGNRVMMLVSGDISNQDIYKAMGVIDSGAVTVPQVITMLHQAESAGAIPNGYAKNASGIMARTYGLDLSTIPEYTSQQTTGVVNGNSTMGSGRVQPDMGQAGAFTEAGRAERPTDQSQGLPADVLRGRNAGGNATGDAGARIPQGGRRSLAEEQSIIDGLVGAGETYTVPHNHPKRIAIERMLDVFEKFSGHRPIVVSNKDSDGFTANGHTFISIDSPHMPIAWTVGHEFTHWAKKYPGLQAFYDQIWHLIDNEQGKRAYYEYLARTTSSIRGSTYDTASAQQLALLEEEMVADFLGKRLWDQAFMTKMALQKPNVFKQFIADWIPLLNGLIVSLRGLKDKIEGVKDVDQYISKLQDAKEIAVKVFESWAKQRPSYAQGMDVNELKNSTKTLDEDIKEQEQWLDSKAKELGYKDTEDLFTKNAKRFMELAKEWRERNPAEMLLSAKDLMAEEAYPDLEWTEAKGTGGSQLTTMVKGGKYPERVEMNQYSGLWDLGIKGTWVGLSMGEKDGYASKEAVQAFAKRQIAARDLVAKKFDLAASMSKQQKMDLVEGWKDLAKIDMKDKPGQGPARYAKTLGSDSSLKEIATSMGITDAFDVTVSREVMDPFNYTYIIKFKNKANNLEFGALLDFHGEGGQKYFTANTLELGKSGLGAAAYQMFAEFAARRNIQIHPEDSLSGINTYRRTEQMLAAGLRTGKSNVMVPHFTQRIYGFENNKAGNAEMHENNFTRLILATIRNARELVKGFDNLRYKPETGKFSFADGQSAEREIHKITKSVDGRAFGLGRSTIARAVLSNQLLQGITKVKDVESFAEPVLYSSKDTAALEYEAVKSKYQNTPKWLKAPNGKKTNLTERQWIQTRTPSFINWFGPWEKYAKKQGGVWGADDVSKAVDENGEPLVVYHGTDNGGFYKFKEPGGTGRGDLGIFTTPNRDMARSYIRRGRETDFTPPLNKADLEEIGVVFAEIEGQYYWDDGYEHGPFESESEAVSEALKNADAGELSGSGLYAAFINIRNPNEEDFGGAHWDGNRFDQFEVYDANGDTAYTKDGREFMSLDEARDLAESIGGTFEDASPFYATTDDIVRAGRRGNDGTIIRNVIDSGGGAYYDDTPADVFVAFKPNQIKSAEWNTGEFGGTDDIRFSKHDDIQKNANVISTRVPTSVGSNGSHLSGQLEVGLDIVMPNSALLAKHADILRTDVMLGSFESTNNAEVVNQFVETLKGNILFLYNNVDENIRNRSRNWYIGANVLANKLAQQYGITEMQASGVLASLSPQTPWDTNVSQAMRVTDIFLTKQDVVTTPEMIAWFDQKIAGLKPEKKDTAETYAKLREFFKQKTLASLPPEQQAWWVRAYDESHNNRQYYLVAPEGEYAEIMLTAKGVPAVMPWGSSGNIVKAIAILKDGSRTNISDNLGAAHKVRSFYNNIYHPYYLGGSVTIDTHAVAAARLEPVTGNSLEVLQAWGGKGSSSVLGTGGLYPEYAEAYRLAANDVGILPREMQSIVWEAVRGLFHENAKSKKLSDEVRSYWDEYANGWSIERVRSTIAPHGVPTPNWARLQFDGRASEAAQSTDNGREQVRSDVRVGRSTERDGLLKSARDLQLSREYKPGASTGVLTEIGSAMDSRAQKRYMLAMRDALSSNVPSVQDLLGWGSDRYSETADGGAWKALSGWSLQSTLRLPNGVLDERTSDEVNFFLAAQGMWTYQEGMANHLPVFGKEGLGVEFNLGGKKLTDVQFEEVYASIMHEFKNYSIPPIPSKDGLRFLNFTGLEQDAFITQIKRALVQTSVAKLWESTYDNQTANTGTATDIRQDDGGNSQMRTESPDLQGQPSNDDNTAFSQDGIRVFDFDGGLIENDWRKGDGEYRELIIKSWEKLKDYPDSKLPKTLSGLNQYLDTQQENANAVNRKFAKRYKLSKPVLTPQERATGVKESFEFPARNKADNAEAFFQNPDGTLMVLYHGGNPIDVVQQKDGISLFASTLPSYANGVAEIASRFAEDGETQAVHPVNVLVKKPFDWRIAGHRDSISLSEYPGGYSKASFNKAMKSGSYELLESPEFAKAAKKAGYDSILVRDESVFSGFLNVGVFDANDVVFAIQRSAKDESGLQSGRADTLGDRESNPAGAGVPPRYGKAIPGASSAVGYHYSQAPRASLNSFFYGRGLKGLEAERLSGSENADIRPRTFFYVDTGRGVKAESGVGGVGHRVQLDNLYDVIADELQIVKKNSGPSNWERAVMKAGFDGYLVQEKNASQGYAVLVGVKHTKVPVEQFTPNGYKAPPEAPQPYKRSLMSAELRAIDIEAVKAIAPSARLRMGTFSVDMNELDAAKAVLKEQGISLPEELQRSARDVRPADRRELEKRRNVLRRLRACLS